jgi:hypothetical protein
MAITKQMVVDQITVTENGIVLYREATRIIEDGVQLTQTYHRTSLTPGQDLTGQPANVVAIAKQHGLPKLSSCIPKLHRLKLHSAWEPKHEQYSNSRGGNRNWGIHLSLARNKYRPDADAA